MHRAPLRIIVATALPICFTGGVLVADAQAYRTPSGWSIPTDRLASGLHARQVLGARRVICRDAHARATPAYQADRLAPSWRVRPNYPFQSPGATVITRQDLDALNATTLRDALRYAPGVIVK